MLGNLSSAQANLSSGMANILLVFMFNLARVVLSSDWILTLSRVMVFQLQHLYLRLGWVGGIKDIWRQGLHFSGCSLIL